MRSNKWKFHLEPRNLLITGILILALTLTTAFTLTVAAKWEVTINDNGVKTVIATNKTTVEEILKEASVAVGEKDIAAFADNGIVKDGSEIVIRRAFSVTVSDIDGEKTLMSAAEDVGGVLAQNGIAVDWDDEVSPELTAAASSNMRIEIVRVDTHEETRTEEVGYEITEMSTDDYERGTVKVLSEGHNGSANVTYSVITKNGEEFYREETSREVISEPVTKVVAVGTKIVSTTGAVGKVASRGSLEGRRYIVCRATAYDGSYATLGKSNPKTALGRTPTVGTVAVDPKVIPLGTKLYIESVDGSYTYGYCFAGDTGGGIKGNRVDLFMASRAQALGFGSKQVKVYILN